MLLNKNRDILLCKAFAVVTLHIRFAFSKAKKFYFRFIFRKIRQYISLVYFMQLAYGSIFADVLFYLLHIIIILKNVEHFTCSTFC